MATGAESGAPAGPTPAPPRHPANTPDPATSDTTTPPRRPATEAERKALASVVRLRILRMCLYDDLTNRELAERLQLNPGTVLHHVRTLVDHEFLVALPPRRGRRGSREVPYRATRKSWTLDMNPAPGSPGAAESSAVSTASASQLLIKTFMAESTAAGNSDLGATRLGLQISEKDWTEFTTRLQSLLEEYASLPHEPGGQRWSILVAMHSE